MSRKVIYRIFKNGDNRFSEEEWGEVERLQHWYNSEFDWSTGRLAMKRYILFPNAEDFQNVDTPIWEVIANRHSSLRRQGLSEPDIITQMEKDRLVIVKWGGYYEDCLASGFTRVADNEWNACLVCDFLLKASTLCPAAAIHVLDEGRFIKSGAVELQNGTVMFGETLPATEAGELSSSGRVFAVVDPTKYHRHPTFQNMIPGFNALKTEERDKLVRNWNWLGYDGNFEVQGDDRVGFDLNKKVRTFVVKRQR